MSYYNHALREICLKIVYYGPGLCGKTTNVEHLHAHTAAASRGQLLSLKTESERTLFFDFMPLDLGTIHGYRLRLMLYTVPGQYPYRAIRKLILKGLDGVVFVADSQVARHDANLVSMDDLRENLVENGFSLDTVPLVIQYNKRDLGDLVPIGELRASLNPCGVPEVLASAASGVGVFETLKAIGRIVIKRQQR
jgi:mutual gliding-motility protein MglA